MAVGPGTRLDAYELLHPLGSGGMGQVWLATEVRLRRRVAVKLLPAQLMQDPTRVRRFEQEARAASALNHPNVCTILALGESSEGQHYIAMEYVEGETLRTRLSSSRLTIRESLEIAIQIASALSVAHDAGIVHRDTKPENVMLRPDGLVKVLDFGLAKLTSGNESAAGSSTRTDFSSEAGTVVGTVAYMSPEQARGQAVDARTDIWSLGVVLYELVAGRSPFAGASSSDVIAAILDRDPSPVARFEPEAPAELERIIGKSLRKDRERRYQNVKDVLLDLLSLRDAKPGSSGSNSAEGRPGQVPATSIPVSIPASQTHPTQSSAEYLIAQARRHKLLTASIGVSMVAAVAGLAWWTLFDSSEASQVMASAEPTVTRLTANPNDLPVSSARISPDGRYLAYADPRGIRIRFIDTGETQMIPETRGMDVYSWSADSTKVLASTCDAGTCGAWQVSLVGGSRHRLGATWREGEAVMPSPDGSRLLRLVVPKEDFAGELMLDLLNGTPPRVVVPDVGAANWSADGKRILFAKRNSSVVESLAVTGGPPVTVFSADQGQEIVDVVESPDRRLIVLILRRPTTSAWFGPEVSLWEVRTDEAGMAVERPHRLTEWQQELEDVSVSADGARLAYLSTASQWDVYVAGFDSRVGLTDMPRRLTLDDRYDVPMAWTPDSTTVLFHSTRNGTSDIFKQRLDSDVAEPLVVGPRDESTPRVTSDGRWVLFDELRGPDNIRVMRVPLTGGTPELVCAIKRGTPFCSARGRCVVIEWRDADVVISAVEPLQGKGPELARVRATIAAINIMPNGDGVAYVGADSPNRLRIVSFKDRSRKDIVVEGATSLASVDWLASGEGFLSADVTTRRSRLLFILPDGTSRVVWSPTQVNVEWAVPSPDGKHLAILASSRQANAWLLTDF